MNKNGLLQFIFGYMGSILYLVCDDNKMIKVYLLQAFYDLKKAFAPVEFKKI